MTTAESLDETLAADAFDIGLDGPFIVQVVRPYATMDVPAAEETLRLALRLLDGSRKPMLVDLRAPCSVDGEARTVFARPAMSEAFSAVALLTTNTVTRLAANLFLKINRPPYPIQMFSDETAARRWLAEHLHP